MWSMRKKKSRQKVQSTSLKDQSLKNGLGQNEGWKIILFPEMYLWVNLKAPKNIHAMTSLKLTVWRNNLTVSDFIAIWCYLTSI